MAAMKREAFHGFKSFLARSRRPETFAPTLASPKACGGRIAVFEPTELNHRWTQMLTEVRSPPIPGDFSRLHSDDAAHRRPASPPTLRICVICAICGRIEFFSGIPISLLFLRGLRARRVSIAGFKFKPGERRGSIRGIPAAECDYTKVAKLAKESIGPRRGTG